MKRAIIVLMSLVLILSLTACEGKNKESDTNVSTDSAISTVATDTESKTTDSDIKEDNGLGRTYKLPLRDFYVDAPNYSELENGYSEIFIIYDEKYCVLTANREGNPTNPKEAHEIAFEKFKMNINNHCHIISTEITKESEETINGIDVYHYEGIMDCEECHNSYFEGYSFIYCDMPCNITGAVIEDDQKQETIDEIKANVTAMMKSVRHEQ